MRDERRALGSGTEWHMGPFCASRIAGGVTETQRQERAAEHGQRVQTALFLLRAFVSLWRIVFLRKTGAVMRFCDHGGAAVFIRVGFAGEFGWRFFWICGRGGLDFWSRARA